MSSAEISADFRPGDRLFQPLYDFLVIAAALIYACRSTTDDPIPITKGMNLDVHSHNIGCTIILPLSGVIQSAMTNELPAYISIGIKKIPDAPPQSKIQTQATDAVMLHIISPIFLMFFERYNDWMDAAYGDAVNWPATLNFARVVRNAIAHGKIHIRNPRAAPVTWQGFSYSHADNGQKIIGPDLRLADLLYLMFDADVELDALNAPVL